MAPKGQGSVYKGALAKPIVLRPPSTFWGAVTKKRVAAYRKQQDRHERANAALKKRKLSKKLVLLFKHYGIANKKDTAALVWALAAEHVPGFAVRFPEGKSRRGRKRKWHPDLLEELYHTVQSIRKQHRFNDRQALKFMVNDQLHPSKWGLPPGHKGSKEQWIETLEARLQEAKGLLKLYDQAQRDLDAAAASVKFRK